MRRTFPPTEGYVSCNSSHFVLKMPYGAVREVVIQLMDPWEFELWIRELRKEEPLSRIIHRVVERLEKADERDHRFLSGELVLLLREDNRNAEALDVLNDLLRRDPDDVRAAISKASIYLYSLDQPEEALRSINDAVVRAHRTGAFRREALGDKARILLKLTRGDELSDVLEEIISLQVVPGVPDIGRERDFVDRAPPGLIRKNVVDRYNEFRPRRPEDSLADEPPEYEPADDRM